MPINLTAGGHLLLWVFPLALTLFVIVQAVVETRSKTVHK